MHAIGIDVGKTSIDLCVAGDGAPKKWPSVEISLTDPLWYQTLTNLTEQALVVLEPTGWHLSRPIVITLLRAGATVYQTNPRNTRHIREAHISGVKTDAMDSRALAYIARLIAEGHPPRSTYPLDSEREALVTQLRLLVNDHVRLTQETVRTINRLRALSFSIWPILSQKLDTYLNAVRVGATTSDQIRTLQRHHFKDGRTYRYIKALANSLPEGLPSDPVTSATITTLTARLDTLEEAKTAVVEKIQNFIFYPPFTEISQRWSTIPNASPMRIAVCLVACRGLVLETTRDEFKAMLGTHPRRDESGMTVVSKQLKSGYRPAMQQTWLWTQGLLAPDAPPNPIRDYFEGQRQTEHVFRAARVKLARLLWGVARDPRGYQYPHQSEEQI